MTIEYQHVTGEWRATAYDSREDDDALPELVPLKGRVTFTAKFDAYDRFAAVPVPGGDDGEAFRLAVRTMVYPVVNGRLIDRQARDGVMLPAVVAGAPIVWSARPELTTDPGRGVKGEPVPADIVTFGPPAPVGGVRAVDLSTVIDVAIEYPEIVVSQVGELAQQATESATDAAASAADAASSESEAAGSAVAAAASADSAQAAADSAGDSASAAAASSSAAQASADAAAGSESTASAAAVAASDSADSAQAAASAADAASGAASSSASAAAESAVSAAGSASAADASAAAASSSESNAASSADAAAASAAEAADVIADQIPNASPTVKGGLWLAGDLGGTAQAPTVPGLADKSDVGHTHRTGDVDGLDAALDGKADLVGGVVPSSQIPAVGLTKPTVVADRDGMLALTAEEGDVAVISDGPDKGSYMLGSGASTSFDSWVKLVAPDAPVQSVNGQQGTVNLGPSDVGAAPADHGHQLDDVDGLDAALDGKAPAHVPVFTLPETGVPGTLYLLRDIGG